MINRFKFSKFFTCLKMLNQFKNYIYYIRQKILLIEFINHFHFVFQ